MKPLFSIEFYPPATAEGVEKLRAVRQRLAPLHPAFYSVTFGAGGSTRERTMETVLEIQAAGESAAPHLSCVGSTRANIIEILNSYAAHGVKRIVALRGDMPSGVVDPGEFRHANELVRFIREETGDRFHLEVAAYPEYHPQAQSPARDLGFFVDKVKAGANSAITQYFYNVDAYWHFVASARASGVDIPIVPGIMPIGNFSRISRFSEMCGAEIPRWIARKMESYGDDSASIKAFGLDVVTELCAKLLAGGAPGLHFYTLNQAGLTLEIWQRLKLSAA